MSAKPKIQSPKPKGKRQVAEVKPVPLLGGFIKVPVRHCATFGASLDLRGLIPPEADCIMVLVNSGGGLNAGHPTPVGFIKLPHQLYVKDLEKLIKEQFKNRGLLWVTVVPIRASEYVDVWSHVLTE